VTVFTHWLLIALTLVVPTATAAPGLGSGRPDGTEGLEAWYAAQHVGSKKASGDLVTEWEDLTANGHHLTIVEDALPAIFSNGQVGGLPALRIRKTTAFEVGNPFDLGDHTIFLVFKATLPDRALFRSESDRFSGLVLGRDGVHDEYHDGGIRPGQVKRYGSRSERGDDYGITILARDEGALRFWLDGSEVSQSTTFNGSIRVGLFFALSHTTFAASDGEGLWIAEMLFYDRFLSDAQRASVTGYLAAKYGIDSGKPSPTVVAVPPEPSAPAMPEGVGWQVAQLSTTTVDNVNQAGFTVPWDRQDELDPSFVHDTEKNPTRLTVTGGATRVRLYVSLPLISRAPDANIRVLFRVNGGTYLSGEGRSGPVGVPEREVRASVHAEVIARLGQGDFVEVVTVPVGGPGEVVIEPGLAVFIAETR